MVSVSVALTAGAQTMYDAINYSFMNYAGTARSMAVGNAMTAVGGDMGAIVVNPAGSAVYNYSEFTVTPGFSISAVESKYSYSGDLHFGSPRKTTDSRFDLPNIGVVLKFNTGSSSGIKGWSMSFMSAQTNNFINNSYASGSNSISSRAAEAAFSTTDYGLLKSVLQTSDAYNRSGYPWDLVSAYQAGVTGSLAENYFIGCNEKLVEDSKGFYHFVPGELRQVSALNQSGAKNDIIINAAVNVNDWIYAGFTLGLPVIRYRYNEGYTESAVNPGDFPVEIASPSGLIESTYYESNSMNYYYSANCSGVYAKLGVIARVTNSLRLGASVQTPTGFSVTENWQYTASASFENSGYNASAKSPVGEYSYKLSTPWIFNAGLAYIYDKLGFLSVDYEMIDYRSMKYRLYEYNTATADYDYIQEVNAGIRKNCAETHNLRVGLEVKPLPFLAVRGGYGFMTNPERGYEFRDGATTFFSFGLGYSSPGTFYFDVAAKRTSYPLSSMTLYYDYDGFNADGEYMTFIAPEISCFRKLWNISMTLGFRF